MTITRWCVAVVCLLLGMSVNTVSGVCDNQAEIVAASVFGTLGFVIVILIVVFLIWYYRRKGKQQQASPHMNGKDGYDNKNFQQDDLEMQKISAQRPNGSAVYHKDVPGAYVTCREYVTPVKDQDAGFSYTQYPKHMDKKTPKSKRTSVQNIINRSGSRGSLDGAYQSGDPEVYSVSLRSQDIIGLGFNISGSMSEGIFISMIHNRGPASESGVMKVGDRIMSITISMENIVYEDALTILSYASPYPVMLRLQRPAPLKSTSTDATLESLISEELALHHPQYRSQSLDDLRKLSRSDSQFQGTTSEDDAFGAIPSPLGHWGRSWSEFKRKDNISHNSAEGKLRKWMATQDIVHEESTNPSPGHTQFHLNDPAVTYKQVGQAHAEHGDRDEESLDDTFLTETDSIEQAALVIVNGNEDDEDTGTQQQQLSNLLLQPIGAEDSAAQVKVNGSGRDKKPSESSDASVSTLSKDSIILESQDKDVTLQSTSKDSDGEKSDVNKNKVDKIDAEFVRESLEAKLMDEVRAEEGSIRSADASMLVNASSTNLSEVGSEEPADSEYSGESMRAVLKDYFGDQPSLLEKLGYTDGKNGPEMNRASSYASSTVSSNDGSNSETSDSRGNKHKHKDKKKSGNIAYYLKIDEGFQPNPSAESWHYYEVDHNVKTPRLVQAGGNQSSDEDTMTEDTKHGDVMTEDTKYEDIVKKPPSPVERNGDVEESQTPNDIVQSNLPDTKLPTDTKPASAPAYANAQESEA